MVVVLINTGLLYNLVDDMVFNIVRNSVLKLVIINNEKRHSILFFMKETKHNKIIL